MQKAYSESRVTESGLDSVANIAHIAPVMSTGHAFINLNIVSAIEIPEEEATTAYRDYIKVMEELLSDANEYAANISTSENDQTIAQLCAELAAQQN